ncbi:hypothetical protein Goshw_024721 [Gossypium schwendimanii]|uniref:Uncharacterized protein n=1 Tax=Gossypium schwendimanii TaxID=34291 RepID=A0A7J9M793_GOSSC|nr:hypothetical protein [Gossypium schwendimanii]
MFQLWVFHVFVIFLFIFCC